MPRLHRILVVFTLLALSACASLAEKRRLEQQLLQLSQELAQQKRRLGTPPANTPPPAPQTDPAPPR